MERERRWISGCTRAAAWVPLVAATVVGVACGDSGGTTSTGTGTTGAGGGMMGTTGAMMTTSGASMMTTTGASMMTTTGASMMTTTGSSMMTTTGSSMTTGSTSASTGTGTTTSTGTGGPVCGNGIVEMGEQCDDGNTTSGDGCSSTCQTETGFTCMGMPSVCTCTMNAFIDCSGTNAVYCDATGKKSVDFACPAPGGCMAGMNLTGCGQCTMSTCTAGTGTNPSKFVTCDTMHDAITAQGDCVTLKAGGNVSACMGSTCQECQGTNVCGDGTHYGTMLGSSYACANGAIGAATPCAFGCNATTGTCADITPANQAGTHLGATDIAAFTCTGTQNPNLVGLTVPAGATVAVDTTAETVTVNGTPVTSGFIWGTAYTPTGSGTSVVVLHVKSLTLGAGAKVTVTGLHALALLVDGDVTAAAGTAAMPTLISVAASTSTGGAGAASTTSGGAGAAAANKDGGGGAGHDGSGGQGGGGNGIVIGTMASLGGGSYSVAAMSELLEAGESGGTGSMTVTTAAGGAGGGALQISACGTISLGANTIVNASGGGGKGGTKGATGINLSGNGGGGGGSGGTILLEAKTFMIAGSLVSNGGGGGGGGGTASATMNGTDGGDWGGTMPGMTLVTSPAKGGTSPGVGANPGLGGDGAAGATNATNGATFASANVGGGGGGGALGPIFLNVPPGAAAPTVGASSPMIKTSHICTTSSMTCTYP